MAGYINIPDSAHSHLMDSLEMNIKDSVHSADLCCMIWQYCSSQCILHVSYLQLEPQNPAVPNISIKNCPETCAILQKINAANYRLREDIFVGSSITQKTTIISKN